MFSGNLKVENSAKIINGVEEGKFPLLLNRIAQFLSDGISSKPFTPTEEEKLEVSLGITKRDVRTIVEGIIEIFQICAYYVAKPSVLGDQLEKQLSLSPKKSEIFVQVWTTFARGIVNNLKQKASFPQLHHIAYSVSVQAASSNAAKEKGTRAQLQLGLFSCNKRKDLNVEFDHEQLHKFYMKLEKIQEQLDGFR